MSLTMSVSTLRFLIEVMIILKAIKSVLEGHMIKKNLTLVFISYEIYETAKGSFNKVHMK